MGAHNLKSKCCYNANSSAYYFHMKSKISVDFQICISVPLREENNSKTEVIKILSENKSSFATSTFQRREITQSISTTRICANAETK